MRPPAKRLGDELGEFEKQQDLDDFTAELRSRTKNDLGPPLGHGPPSCILG